MNNSGSKMRLFKCLYRNGIRIFYPDSSRTIGTLQKIEKPIHTSNILSCETNKQTKTICLN